MATRAAYGEFMRVLSDPSSTQRLASHAPVEAQYLRRWARYTNGIFEDRPFWSGYLSRHGMYRYTRPVFNPARNLGDFYSGMIYSGVLSTDAKRLPDGTTLAIPLAPDIDPQLASAVGQLWQWSNWQDGMVLMTLFGSVLGDVLVEAVDEVDRGKVTNDVLWPGWITHLELDGTANVKAYTVEYDAEDDDGKTYTYRKEVDSETIAEFKDDKLFQYDEGIEAERANPYGFAPAVWCRHQNIGTNYGAPALRNEHSVDELNSLASHAYDRSHAVLGSPILVSGAQSNTLLAAAAASGKLPSASASMPFDNSGRESIKLLTASADAGVHSIELPEGEVADRLDRLWSGIEREHPELTLYAQLRAMSQVTGPGAEFLIGDTANYVNRARAGYDTQSVKLFQMSIAIAGWRANSGAWGRNLTRQQKAFLPFGLESYHRGDLDMEILQRSISPQGRLTPDEKRAIMEAVDRGMMPRSKGIEALGGNAVEDMRLIEQEQGVGQAQVPQTIDELSAALQRNQQPATVPAQPAA